MIMALLLDLATVVGGFLLAAAVLRRLPRVGDDLGRVATRLAPFGWVIGIVALVAGGYYLIVHLFSGPRVFHFEVVGIAVGLVLLRGRLTVGWASASGASGATTLRRGEDATNLAGARDPADTRGPAPGQPATVTGPTLLLAVFGLIAMIVGIQGLFTPDG